MISLWATSVRVTSAPEASDRAIQPQTTLPSPRLSKKRTLKVVFSLQLFCLFAAPPGSPPQPKSWAARLSSGHSRWSRTSKGITCSLWVHETRTKPPACRPTAPHPWSPPPPQRPLDVDDVSVVCADRGSSIAPTGLWCPDGSYTTARASLEPLLPRYQPRGRPARRTVTVGRHRILPSHSTYRPPPGPVFLFSPGGSSRSRLFSAPSSMLISRSSTQRDNEVGRLLFCHAPPGSWRIETAKIPAQNQQPKRSGERTDGS